MSNGHPGASIVTSTAACSTGGLEASNSISHALRGLFNFIWLIMLPAGLVSSGCTSFAKLVGVTTAVAYVMLGIDEIGVQIENPFDILPQHALAGALAAHVDVVGYVA